MPIVIVVKIWNTIFNTQIHKKKHDINLTLIIYIEKKLRISFLNFIVKIQKKLTCNLKTSGIHVSSKVKEIPKLIIHSI